VIFQHGREVPIPELPVQRAARGEVVKEQEYEVVFPDGARRHIFGSAAPLRDREGRVRGAIAALLDISKRREVEIELERAKHEAERHAQALAEQARTLEVLLEFVPEGIVMIGGPPDFRVIAVSRYGREMIGLPASSIVGAEAGPHARRFGFLRADGTPPRPEEIPSWRALHHGEVVEHEEWLIRRVDGTTFRVALRSAPIRNAGGDIIGAIACWEDVSRQKEAEEALRRSEALYRAVGESTRYGAFVCDGEGRNIYASPSFLELVGMTQEQCAALGWMSALHPDDHAPVTAAWQECLRAGSPLDCEQRFLGRDGRYHPVLARGVPIRDDDGRIVQWAGLLLDVSNMKSAEERLRAADRRKDEFLATLAHELRNPLAPIRNAVRLLQHRGPDEPELAWSRDVIDRQVTHMGRLLDDLLDLSRIELDKLELQHERVTIGSVLESALETSRPALEAGRHQLALDLGAHDATVLGDRLRLAQVFANLLNNAAKYTGRSGHVVVSARRDGECVTVRVRDDGIGFAPHEAAGLFEMFSQTEAARAHSGGGLGIGLALVRGLVEKHGGHVSAHSEGPGRGSEFVVTLPLAPALAPIEATPDGRSVVPARGRRVLVADDNEDAAESLAMLLRLRGHEVRTAHDGVEALAAAEAFRPEAAVIDVGMPGLSGLEVAERIRREPWGRGMLLVALTGWGQAEDRRRTDAAGFDHHLVKPAEPAELDHLLAASPAGR
jgi:two-component system CheB/CheR fusion protein